MRRSTTGFWNQTLAIVIFGHVPTPMFNTIRFGELNISDQPWVIVIFWSIACTSLKYNNLNLAKKSLQHMSNKYSYIHQHYLSSKLFLHSFKNTYLQKTQPLECTRPLLFIVELLNKCTLMKKTPTLIIKIICSIDMSQCIQFVVNQFLQYPKS